MAIHSVHHRRLPLYPSGSFGRSTTSVAKFGCLHGHARLGAGDPLPRPTDAAGEASHCTFYFCSALNSQPLFLRYNRAFRSVPVLQLHGFLVPFRFQVGALRNEQREIVQSND